MSIPENMAVEGQPLAFALQSYFPPALGAGPRLADFTPEGRFMPPTDALKRKQELDVAHLYGTPYTHFQQQIQARNYGIQHMGFSNGPLTFVVNWRYFKPGLFTVQKFPANGSSQVSWVQEETEAL